MYPYIIICGGFALCALVLVTYANYYRRVPPNAAMIVYGTQLPGGFEVVTSGGRFIMPSMEDVGYLSLELHTLDLELGGVDTSNDKVELDVEVSGQVRISSDPELIRAAASMLMGKPPEEIEKIAARVVEGHLRGVFAGKSPAEASTGRVPLAEDIRKEAEGELNTFGLTMVSFFIRNIDRKD